MKPRTILIFWVLAVLIITPACAVESLIAQPTAEATQVASTSGPEMTLSAGLVGLPSYRAQMLVQFTGADGQSQVSQASIEVLDEMNQAQQARHLLAKTLIQGRAPDSVETYTLGGETFLIGNDVNNQPTCMKLDAEQAKSQPMDIIEASDIIQSFQPGELVAAGEMVNGVATDHYKVTQIHLGIGSVSKTEGDLWVDSKSRSVLRYKGWAEGGITLTGQAETGRIDWDYYLLDIGKAEVKLLVDCTQNGIANLPVPENSTEINRTDTTLSFQNGANASTLEGLYIQTLIQHGWTIDAEAGNVTSFSLTVSKGGQSIQILISGKGEGSKVEATRK
jgi:hypothetical protein